MCHSLGLAQSNPPTRTKIGISDVIFEFFMKTRVGIIQNFEFLNFRLELEYFSEI